MRVQPFRRARGYQSVSTIAETADDADRWFIELYDQHRSAVFSAALRLCARWADAEDLAAETFVRAYRLPEATARNAAPRCDPGPG